MATYDLGDLVTLRTVVADDSGTATDATVALTVTAPDGTDSTPDITHGVTGAYSATFTPAVVGTWFFRWTTSGAIVAVESGQFTVADPAPPAYASLTQLKTRLGIKGTGSDQDVLDTLITASRGVDDDCGRRFWLDVTATQRIFNPDHREVRQRDGFALLIDDIGSIDGLLVETGFGDTWSTMTNYEIQPDNGLSRGRPVTGLLAFFRPWQFFPTDRVRITAHWGWPTIPVQISQATLIRAQRLFRRKDSPEGVAGFNDMGIVRLSRYDSDYENLIGPFVQPGFGGRA